MLKLTVKIPTEDSVNQAFKNYRRQSIEKSQDILLTAMIQEMVNRNMVAEGDAIEAWEITPLEETMDVSKVAVTNADPAVSALEYGTKPAGSGEGGGDIFEDILRWVKAKPVIPSYGTQEQFAFVVARKIAEQGLPLSGGIKRPFSNAQKKAKRRIDKVWETGLPNLIRDIERGAYGD